MEFLRIWFGSLDSIPSVEMVAMQERTIDRIQPATAQTDARPERTIRIYLENPVSPNRRDAGAHGSAESVEIHHSARSDAMLERNLIALRHHIPVWAIRAVDAIYANHANHAKDANHMNKTQFM